MKRSSRVCTIKEFEEVEAIIKKALSLQANPNEIIITIGNDEELISFYESAEKAKEIFNEIKNCLTPSLLWSKKTYES
jgi:hypothetical protein